MTRYEDNSEPTTEGYYCARPGCPNPKLDPNSPDVVTAYRQISVNNLGDRATRIDGEGVCYHRSCYPGDSPSLRRAG